MRSLNLNRPRRRRGGTLFGVILAIIIVFVICFLFYEINQANNQNKNYQKDYEKCDTKLKKFEKELTDLKTQNKELENKLATCTSLENSKFAIKEGVYIEFVSKTQFKEVNGTNEVAGKYIFKDSIVTYNYAENPITYYYIISQDCKKLYKTDYQKNQIYVFEKVDVSKQNKVQ